MIGAWESVIGDVVLVGTLVAAVGLATFGGIVWRRHDVPGAKWLTASIAGQAVFCGAIGVGFLFGGLGTRLALDIAAWVGLSWVPVPYLGFTVAYSGRRDLSSHTAGRLLLAYPIASTAIMVTAPFHELLWADVAVVRQFGLFTMRHQLTGVGIALIGTGLLIVLIGVVVLAETAIQYERYRTEAATLVASSLPATVATGSLFAPGATGLPNLVPLSYLPQLFAFWYAVVRTDAFEYAPATRRAAADGSLDRLSFPVVLVALDRTVIDFNEAAAEAFGADADSIRSPLTELVGRAVPLDEETTIRVRAADRRRWFAVRPAPVTNRSGTTVAHSVAFQDVTLQRRREQRLDVLNRVLRHNIRNDLNVVVGNVRLARESPSGDSAASLEAAERRGQALIELAEEARRVEGMLDVLGDRHERIELRSFLAEAVETAQPSAASSVESESVAVWGDEVVLRTAVGSLEKTVRRETDNELSVRVTARPAEAIGDGGTRGARRGTVAVEFDTGESLPEHEVEALRAGTETALNHATGLAPWTARWGVEAVGGELRFDREATATLLLPRAGCPESDAAE